MSSTSLDNQLSNQITGAPAQDKNRTALNNIFRRQVTKAVSRSAVQLDEAV